METIAQLWYVWAACTVIFAVIAIPMHWKNFESNRSKMALSNAQFTLFKDPKNIKKLEEAVIEPPNAVAIVIASVACYGSAGMFVFSIILHLITFATKG